MGSVPGLRALGPDGAPPMTLADLPAAVRERFISPQGTYLLRVVPVPGYLEFRAPETDSSRVSGEWTPMPSGDPVLLYVFTPGFRNSILWAAGMALLVIAVMLMLLFRSLKMAMLALIPLVVGTGLTLNLMWLARPALQPGQRPVPAVDPGGGDRIRHHHPDPLATWRNRPGLSPCRPAPPKVWPWRP